MKIKKILKKWLGVTEEVEVVTLIRLHPKQYDILEKKYQCNASTESTPTQVAWALGAQHVLREIRNGFVEG